MGLVHCQEPGQVTNTFYYATCYPEAIALSSTEAEKVAKELVILFSRVGIPDEILSDFMSALLQELYRMLSISPPGRS